MSLKSKLVVNTAQTKKVCLTVDNLCTLNYIFGILHFFFCSCSASSTQMSIDGGGHWPVIVDYNVANRDRMHKIQYHTELDWTKSKTCRKLYAAMSISLTEYR